MDTKITLSATSEIGNQIPVKDSLLIPIIALFYVPFVIFLLMLTRFSDDPFSVGFNIYLYSGMFLVILLPIYTVYLIWKTWQRFKKSSFTYTVTIIHILSFIIPFIWLLMFAWFTINFNGIVQTVNKYHNPIKLVKNFFSITSQSCSSN